MFTAKLDHVTTVRKTFISDPFNFVSLGSSLLINIIHWALLYYKFKDYASSILVHYNVVSGPDFVARASYAYFIPLTALVILAVNLACSVYFYKREKLASYFLNFSNLAIQILFLAASIIVIAINA